MARHKLTNMFCLLLSAAALPMAMADQLLLAQINQLRNSNVCNAEELTWNSTLASTAQQHGQYLVKRGKLTHRGENKSTLGERVTKSGYVWQLVAENLAQTDSSEQKVARLWAQSGPHRKNLCGLRYQEFGAAKVGDMWVAVFAKPQK